MRRLFASLITAAALSTSLTTGAVAQPAMPPGFDIQSMIGGPYSVPAGQTTTVDIGIPVDANYSGDGWNVVSSGTAVTVTAPASGSVNVPVSGAGQSATITLIAEEGAAPPEVPADLSEMIETPAGDSGGNDGSGGANGGGGANSDGNNTSDDNDGTNGPGSGGTRISPDGVDRSKADQIHLESTISGNVISAKLGIAQAATLYKQFGDISTDGMKMRYLDVNDNQISGVKRNIDKQNLTLTLTYPEGQTPDNPFIMEAYRDGAAVAIVTLKDPNAPIVEPTNPAESPSQPETVSVSKDNTTLGLIAVAAVVGLVLLVALIMLLVRLFRKPKH